MVKRICTVLGAIFLLVGFVGFAAPNFLGAHLSPVHNVIHIVSGIAALFFGLKGTLQSARLFSLIFGIVYLLLGVVGIVAGAPGDKMLTVIPGELVFGMMDHGIHIILGGLFLVAALSTKVSALHHHEAPSR